MLSGPFSFSGVVHEAHSLLAGRSRRCAPGCARQAGNRGRRSVVSGGAPMTVAVVSNPPAVLSPPRRIVAMVPGLVALALIGYAGKVAEQSIAAYGRAHHLTLPNIEYVLW